MMEKKAACISAGGSLGAYTAGVLNRIGPEYYFVGGSSVGALMAGLTAASKYDRLANVMRNVEDSDIYSVSPWTKKGRLHVGKLIYRLARGVFKNTDSIGEGKKLRSLIDQYYTTSLYDQLLAEGKRFMVSCQEIRWSEPGVHYFYSEEIDKAMNDFIYFSACAPLLFEFNYRKHLKGQNTLGYADSGVTEILPLKKVLEEGYKNVDVYIHRHKPGRGGHLKSRPKNIPSAFFRIFTIMRNHIEKQNLEEGLRYAQEVGAKITITWLHPDIDESEGLHFNKDTMRRSYDLGRKEIAESEVHDFTSVIPSADIKSYYKDPELVIRRCQNFQSISDQKRMTRKLVHNLLSPTNDSKRKTRTA